MHVTFLVPHTPEVAGYDSGEEFLSYAQYHEKYCEAVSCAGHDAELVYFDSDFDGAERSKGYDVHGFPVTVGDSFGREVSLSALRHIVRTEPDVLHVQGYNQVNVLPFLLAAAVTDTPVVLQNHGPALDYSELKSRLWYRTLAAAVRPLNVALLSVNRPELANVERANVTKDGGTYVPSAIDTSLFTPKEPSECRDQLGLSTETPYVLFVGRLVRVKGPFYLLRALGELPAELDDVELLFVYGGQDDDERARLRRTCESMGIAERVHFVGSVTRERLPLYYSAADVCAFPSLREGFGMVTIEAMSCGTPVIGTDAHAETGHLVHERNALVAESGSAASLANSLRRVLTDSDLRETLVRNGREYVRENHTWDAVQEHLLDTYERLLSRTR